MVLMLAGIIPVLQFDNCLAQDKPVFSLPFVLVDNRPFIEVKIKQQTLHFILDCGANYAMDLHTAQLLGLKLTGKSMQGGAGPKNVPFWQAVVGETSIGPEKLIKVNYSVTDLSQIKNGLHLPYLDGAIGYGFMKNYAVQFDYPHHVINFYRQYSAASPVPFTLYYGQIPEIKVKTDGNAATVIVDTGDRTAFTIFRHYADRTGISKTYELSDTSITGYGVGGAILARTLILKQLEIGKIKLADVPSRIPMLTTGMFAATDVDGSIGGGVLKRFKFTIDYNKQVLYFE